MRQQAPAAGPRCCRPLPASLQLPSRAPGPARPFRQASALPARPASASAQGAPATGGDKDRSGIGGSASDRQLERRAWAARHRYESEAAGQSTRLHDSQTVRKRKHGSKNPERGTKHGGARARSARGPKGRPRRRQQRSQGDHIICHGWKSGEKVSAVPDVRAATAVVTRPGPSPRPARSGRPS